MTDLSTRVIWITGGGSGIGRATALELARGGATVYISGRRPEALEAVAASCDAAGALAIPVPLDVADAVAVEHTVADIMARSGCIDVLVNAAGNNIPNRSWSQLSVEDWNFVNAVNISGAFHCIRSVLPGMRARRSGLILNISSWGGRFSLKLTGPAYGATKRALNALTETLNLEEGDNGIRACAILPAAVNTEFLGKRNEALPAEELAKMLQPEDIAKIVRFLVEAPEHVCVNEILLSPRENYVYQKSA